MELSIKTQAIWLSCDPIDFRKPIDGLCEVVQVQFDMLPHQGIFIFLNNPRNRIKDLLWHNNGFMLIYKRFETGKLFIRKTKENKIELNVDQFNWLILDVDWITLSGENTPQYSEFI